MSLPEVGAQSVGRALSWLLAQAERGEDVLGKKVGLGERRQLHEEGPVGEVRG